MRIVSGSRGGRRLKSPGGLRIRPTPDRVREALFSILGHRVQNARFLDLYAGTGAVGLEALSRGAASTDFVERSDAARRIIRTNVERLEFAERVRIFSWKLPGALERLAALDLEYDLIFADPPYRTPDAARVMETPALRTVCAQGGLVVMEVEKKVSFDHPGWICTSRRDYGDTSLLFLTEETP